MGEMKAPQAEIRSAKTNTSAEKRPIILLSEVIRPIMLQMNSCWVRLLSLIEGGNYARPCEKWDGGGAWWMEVKDDFVGSTQLAQAHAKRHKICQYPKLGSAEF